MRPLVLAVTLLLTACGAAVTDSAPDPAALTAQMRRILSRREVATWLLDRDFARAERIDFDDTLQVEVLQRSETGAPDLLVLRLRIRATARVVDPPRLPEELGRRFWPDMTAAEREKFQRTLATAKAAAAKAQPEASRSRSVDVLKQVVVQVRHDGTTWNLVLPADLEAAGAGP